MDGEQIVSEPAPEAGAKGGAGAKAGGDSNEGKRLELLWATNRWKRPPPQSRPSIYITGFGFYATGPPPPLPPSRAKAKARWKLVANFLRPKAPAAAAAESDELRAVSVRRHATFDLLPREPVAKPACDKDEGCEEGVQFEWINYTVKGGGVGGVGVLVRQRVEGKVTLRDMRESRESKVDNTGNVCIWPSEEVMAVCLLERSAELLGKNVCELGAGGGLAGLALCACVGANSVLITDGNAQCVETLGVAVRANEESMGVLPCGEASVRLLIWSEELTRLDVPRAGTYDIVCSADCLFFEMYHKALVHTLDVLLSDQGKAIIWAPLRGGSLERFCALAGDKFEIDKQERYSDAVWEAHQRALKAEGGQYDADIHYPLLLTLTRKRNKIVAPPTWASNHGGGCKCCKGKRMPMW